MEIEAQAERERQEAEENSPEAIARREAIEADKKLKEEMEALRRKYAEEEEL